MLTFEPIRCNTLLGGNIEIEIGRCMIYHTHIYIYLCTVYHISIYWIFSELLYNMILCFPATNALKVSFKG